MLRSLRVLPDGSWALLSDNGRYPPVVVQAGEKTMFDVLDQVAMRNNLSVM